MTTPLIEKAARAPIHLAKKISPDHIRGTICGERGPFTLKRNEVTCRACLDEPILVSREEYLGETGWRETPRGWVKEGGFGKPLAADEAYQIQTILDGLDEEP